MYGIVRCFSRRELGESRVSLSYRSFCLFVVDITSCHNMLHLFQALIVPIDGENRHWQALIAGKSEAVIAATENRILDYDVNRGSDEESIGDDRRLVGQIQHASNW